ncbi:hypothetical protein [Paludisphaera sp.]|uniref:hypothetical protein n=1 Tax=Paludisphaera sp. TaxID=2017432 RepID=UPI00301CB0F4
MNVARFLGVAAIVALCPSGLDARAQQSAPASHFGRTTSASADGPAPGRRAAAPRRATAPRPTADPLAPYTSRPVAAYRSSPIATPPEPPRPRVTPRNYYPTARVGRYTSPTLHVGGRCVPSRGSVLGMMGMRR